MCVCVCKTERAREKKNNEDSAISAVQLCDLISSLTGATLTLSVSLSGVNWCLSKRRLNINGQVCGNVVRCEQARYLTNIDCFLQHTTAQFGSGNSQKAAHLCVNTD